MKQRMKFKIAILFCYLAKYRIFDPLTEWYLERNGFGRKGGAK